MILLYLLSLIAVLVLFVPTSLIPAIVKWPSSFLIVFLVVFIYNCCKKDTVYLVKESKKKIINRGLFNPLLLYFSAVLYIFGFTLISSQLAFYNVTDYIKEFNSIIDVFNASNVNNVLMGLILIVMSILVYYFRYLFKANAENSSLRGRAFIYIGISLISILIGFINIISFNEFILADYLKTGYNWIIFLGLIVIVLFVDLIAFLIRVHLRKKRMIRDLVKAQRPDKVEEKVIEPAPVKPTRKELKAAKKQAKIDKIVAKKVAKIDEKVAKKEGKKPEAIPVLENLETKEAPLSRKDKKCAKKQAKIDKKVAKKQAKNAKKCAKKEAKINKKVTKIKNKIEKRVNE